MIRQKINDRWTFTKGNRSMMDLFTESENAAGFVTLPHDAMILETRDPACKNANHTGFYPGGQYTYLKKLDVPDDWSGKSVTLEFEGIAGFSRIYVNDDYAGSCLNSYRNFLVPIDKLLVFGQTNEIKVEVNNPEQSSRWYSGSGIYRNVNLLVGEKVRLKPDGVRITTPYVTEQYATVTVQTGLINSDTSNHKVRLCVEILDKDGNLAASDMIQVTVFSEETVTSYQSVALLRPMLWSDEEPNLYICHVSVIEDGRELDEESVSLGVRVLSISAERGLRVNGREVKLRGTCIHHDNGVIGAVTLERAEERRCEQLKNAGFNCIRISHHPMSKAMLDACDRLGIYVIDELTDMWSRTKCPNDYAQFFPEQWERDVESMVTKDFNHPSVILYSTGNEIQEAGTAAGAAWNRKISNRLKELDATRFTTSGINGLLAGNSRMVEIMAQAFGLTSEQMKERMTAKEAQTSDEAEAGRAEKKGAGGADELNGMMNVMLGPVADAIATSPILLDMIDEFTSSMDVAGYNYLTALHEKERELHPNRVVLGTETFPGDIVNLWDVVKGNSHVIGDMTWTGYDYLGEAGCGIFHYDGTVNFTSHWPDRLAYIGDIDLTGWRRPISYLRECVYGLRKTPYLAVNRMNRSGQQASRTPWMWKDNIASWTWPGYEGRTAMVDVYADAEEVELLLNGKSCGRKNVAGSYVTTYEIEYEPGILCVKSYRGNRECGEMELKTAGNVTAIAVTADREQMKANGGDLAYVDISLTDSQGRENLWDSRKIKVTVEGAGSLQGMGSADPQSETSYQEDEWMTYDGHLLAVVRASMEQGRILIRVQAEGLPEVVKEIDSNRSILFDAWNRCNG